MSTKTEKIKVVLRKIDKVIRKTPEKVLTKVENIASRVSLSKKLKGKKFKKQPTATISIKEKEIADYSSDRKRFFKEELEEDRRALFFAWNSKLWRGEK